MAFTIVSWNTFSADPIANENARSTIALIGTPLLFIKRGRASVDRGTVKAGTSSRRPFLAVEHYFTLFVLRRELLSRQDSWIASRILSSASASVSPCDAQPGRPGTHTLKPSSVFLSDTV
jgi:hypothetical protein